MTSRSYPDSAPAVTYTYDADNRQTRHTRTGISDTSYAYDGDGRRVKKADSANTTIFVYDAEGKLVADYTTAAPATNGTSYLTLDTLGSTRVVTTASGNVRARHDLMPFGEELASNTAGRSAVSDNSVFDG